MKARERTREAYGVEVLMKNNRVNPELEKKMLKKHDTMQKALLWISMNEEELKRSYLNKYIAVKGNKVYFSSDDFEALLKVMIASKQDLNTFALKRVKKEASCLLL